MKFWILLHLFLVGSAQAGICDGQPNASAPSLTSALCSQGERQGVYLDTGLNLCQRVSNPKTGNYLICGDALSRNTTLISGEAWPIARSVLESASRLPGLFQNQKGQVWDHDLNHAATIATNHVKGLSESLESLKKTEQGYFQKKFLPSVRGKIVDRHGVPLADNRPAFNIYMVPDKSQAAAAPVSTRIPFLQHSH